MNEHLKDAGEGGEVAVAIFKNGRSRAVRIPKEFDLEGDRAIMVRQPDGSILMRTAVTAGLIEYLKQAEAWSGEDFVENDDDLAPLGEVEI
ncbi:AbrB/MazE/SpoVT family DNA-binding domain-containing protein [Rhizobium rosettiformans]|uniref:AbrB/MazE/SpoVT family DNA-binding domain-containing protein n=1 Tax=Rhizobium rosettiformans TaxID=1368430 RepID=A0ABX7EQA8_9HYPH|nr:AbrB/MazE/SpoVT family DNA-binding domain-containing protein [Rhizobium rosettiformans]QRF50135.1 AbrB/MazE/SpoVT family DNA-binding domain-containing protein [Rhizobium rosettiformans]